MGAGVLKSELAGSWYTDDPRLLSREIRAYLDSVNPEPVDDLIALLLPHAGYRYSGRVAAHGIKLLEGRSYKRVIVIGPSHHVALRDCVSIPSATHIETPLGLIELDTEAISNLWENEAFGSHPSAHESEHSVQIELPFLQEALGSDFKLIPVVCGQLTAESATMIGRQLLPLLEDETLLVISSDFTHYGRNFDYVPFEDDIKRNIESLDMGAFRLIEQKKLNEFLIYIRNTGATICGRSPIAVLLSMLADDAQVKRLNYETSGSLTGDWSQCVSYLSAAVSGQWKSAVEEVPESAFQSLELSAMDKMHLLELARFKIASRFEGRPVEPELEVSAAMEVTMGAFVTIHKQGQLRGCIGEIFPRRPLIEAVSEHAVNAAFHDPRFPNLRENELSEIDLEISALTPPHRVSSYEDIVIGKHGVVLSKNMQSAVFLPQVAVEQGWDLEATLSHLAMKAGLSSNDWKSDGEFHVFEAVVFSEMD